MNSNPESALNKALDKAYEVVKGANVIICYHLKRDVKPGLEWMQNKDDFAAIKYTDKQELQKLPHALPSLPRNYQELSK